ncbi:MAG: iron(III) transport system substrate-binding protein [Solirubrobacteraceae bacterium]|jgi:iron(III) transport system substrate-binding protein|nr:iron(III) transport system substrate-binding protein [Solirubrobacteraceae bacterium]
MSRLGKLLCCALLASTPALLAACGSSGSAGPGGSQDSITLYSGQHEQTTALLVSAFERQTGIKVNVRSADEATLGNQILQEQANSPADVFYAENTPVLELLRERGLLAPVDSATLAAIPARYDSAQGDWVGVSARVSVLVYNKSKVGTAKLPTSILELASPQWAGKVGFAPSETDFQPLLSAIEKLDGRAAAERWLKALKGSATIYPDNETVVTQVNNGQSTIGPINQYYWYRLRAEQGAAGTHSALQYFAPGDAGDLVDVSGAAVLKSSSHQTSAQRFLAFLVSANGQQVLAHSHSFEYPLRQGVAPAAGLRPLSQIKSNSLTPAELGDGRVPLELEQRLGLL